MGTGNEQTLQVKEFRGVNRFRGGPTTAPNQFRKLQNLYAPTRDILESIRGVSSQGSTFPGATELIGCDFLENNIGYERLLIWAKHNDISAAPTISAGHFSVVSGTPGGSRTFAYSYVGLGGEGTLSADQAVNVEDTKFRFQPTQPTAGNGVCGANLYIKNGARYILVGGCWFNNGGTSLPYIEIDNTVNTAISLLPQTFAPPDGAYLIDSMSVTVANTTTDQDKFLNSKNYYIGVAGYLTGSAAGPIGTKIITTAGATPTAMTVAVPSTHNVIDVTLTIPSTVGAVQNILYNGGWIYVFVSPTPEDYMMAPIGSIFGGSTIPNGMSALVPINAAGTATFRIQNLPQNHNNGAWTGSNSSLAGRRSYFFGQYDAYVNTLESGAASSTGTGGTGILITAGETPTSPAKNATTCLACYAMSAIPYSSASTYQILPVRGAPNFTKDYLSGSLSGFTGIDIASQGYNQPKGFNSFFVFNPASYPSAVGDMVSALGANRIYYQNNHQSPFYTNGYTLVPMGRDYQTVNFPIGNTLLIFKNRMVVGLPNDSFTGQSGILTYSEVGNFNSFTASPSVTPSFNFVTAINFQNGDEIKQLGVYSNSVATSGPLNQLVVGKDKSVFVLTDVTGAAQEITRGMGFASSKAFFNSNIGPGFVAKDNVYLILGNSGTLPICNAFSDILKTATDVEVVFHEQHIKITFTDTDSVQKQIWCDVQVDDDTGQPRRLWYGPHIMQEVEAQAVDVRFDGEDEVRVGVNGTNLYLLDDPSVFTNVGVAIDREIEFNELSLATEHGSKILEQIYMGTKITAIQEQFAVRAVFDKSYGGSSSLNMVQDRDGAYDWDAVGSGYDIASYEEDEKYALYQMFFRNRTVGRILDLVLTNSSSSNIKILDLSVLFKLEQRRRIQRGRPER